jgi:hypothetical protein
MRKHNAAGVCTDGKDVVKYHKFHSDFDDKNSIVIFPEKIFGTQYIVPGKIMAL